MTTTELYYSAICVDPDMVEVVQMFLDELPERIARLHNALEQRSFSSLATFAHQLKGAGGSYGFPQLTDPAARLEQLAKQQAGDAELGAALDALVAITAQLRAAPAI